MAGALTSGDGCRVCGNESGNVLHAAREMFFGTRHPFTYVECGACSTLQLREVPDLRPYYTDDYYSFRPSGDAGESSSSSSLTKHLASFIRARAAGAGR